MKRKKISNTLLAILLGFSLVACKDKSTDQEPSSKEEKIEESLEASEKDNENNKDKTSKDGKLAVNIKNKSRKGSHPVKKDFDNDKTDKVINDNPKPSNESQTENQKEDDNKEEISEKEVTKVDDKKEDDDVIYVTDDGSYYTAPNPNSDGEVGEYGTPQAYYIHIEGNTFIVKGTMSFNSNRDEILPNNTYSFEVTDETLFVGVGAEGEFPMDRERFNDSPTPALTLEVVDGKVSKVIGSS